ncbi:MAG: CHAT domain-containing protein [Candidatus Zixiibacteriota bacterium]|nr:MAG: CHAT domain-containing protein [candidate division Zixibacteria bacterium]
MRRSPSQKTKLWILPTLAALALSSLASQPYEDWLPVAEELAASGQLDSARTVYRQAVQAAEWQYTSTDSTVDIIFFPDGVRTPVYFDSFVAAEEAYSALLSSAEKIFGPDAVETSDALFKLVEVKRLMGKYYDAQPLARRALDIREKAFGSHDARVAEALDALGVTYYWLGRGINAVTYIDSAFIMRDSLLGPEHPAVARSCLNMARVLIKLGYYDDAEQLSRRAMDIVEAHFGDGSIEVADCLEWIGMSLYFRNDNAPAESLYVMALEIRLRHLGTRHPDIATTYLRLANVYRFMDRFEESDSFYVRAAELRGAIFGSAHPEVAEVLYYRGQLQQLNLMNYVQAESLYYAAFDIRQRTLDTLHPDFAEIVYRMGAVSKNEQKYQEAEAYAHRALPLIETIFGTEYPRYYHTIKLLANLFDDQGQFMEAMPLYQQTKLLAAKIYGESSLPLATAFRDVGFLYYRLGSFDKAETEFMRALEIYRQVRGERSPGVADVMGDLALIYHGQGRYDEAIEMFQQALSILGEFPEQDTSETNAVAKLNLAMVYYDAQRLEQAETNQEEALALLEALFGPRYSSIAIGLSNLGLIYKALHRYSEADSVLRLSIEIGEEALGPQNPGLAHALNNLANLYTHMGKYDQARPIQERAVSILETALGPQHPEVAKFRKDLGRLYACAGMSAESRDSYDKFIDWSQRYLENVFPYSSEQQKLVWISKYPIVDPTVFSLALKDKAPSSRKLALEMLLKSKAMVIEAVMAEKQAAYCHYDDEILVELDRLNEINSLIASLSLAGGYYIDSVATLYKMKDSIEVALSLHCSEFSDALAARRFEVGDIVSLIPNGAVLWEFVRYQPANLDMSVTGDDKLEPPRYLAFTVNRTGNVKLKDLGDAHRIDSLIITAREMIYKAQPQIYSAAARIAEQRLNEVTRQLYDLLFAPLSSAESDIYVSPDGLLNLLPLEILVLPDGSYAIEKYRISYLSSGRDLIKQKGYMESEGEILLFADPDFDGTATRTIISDELFGPDMRGNTDCLDQRFNPLPYSRTEASSVAACFRNANATSLRERYGTMASEESLKDLTTAPKVIHLATHGFFCESVDTSIELLNNPLLRSGLVLTGANRTISGERDDSTMTEDGILTALEVSGLNLVGTDLAVLSACESGVGEFVNGEGLFGLRRAFQHAGVETIVMSLWSVPDKETSELMDGFYRRWLAGSSRRDALRESALEVLRQSRAKRGCGHPLLWGGFILAGNPN